MVKTGLAVCCILLGFLAMAEPCGAAIATVGQVEILSGADLEPYLETRGGVSYISIPGTVPWALEGSEEAYRAMPAALVEEAVRAVEFPILDLEIKVVILPVPRRYVPESSAEGRIIFLSPGRIEYPEEHIHYIVAHEIGHVVQHLLMPDSRQDLWRRYGVLRGLETGVGASSGDHARRPAEIFAEDFRVLFGGHFARCGGNVENHDLEPPEAVTGLRDFMLALVGEWSGRTRIGAYPNPFTADILFEAFSTGEERRPPEVKIFDASGRMVRELKPMGGRSVYTVWDGMGEGGRPAASGVYFAHISVGQDLLVRKVIKR